MSGAGPAPRTDRMLCDSMLGKLARYLRMCGYDAAYAGDRGVATDDAVEADERLAATAADEGRRLLTRDRSLAERTPGAVLLYEREIDGQLRELRDAGFDLSLAEPPSRCGRCNGRLDPLDPAEPRPGYAPDERRVWRCRDCGQCFWMGSHWDDVRERLAEL